MGQCCNGCVPCAVHRFVGEERRCAFTAQEHFHVTAAVFVCSWRCCKQYAAPYAPCARKNVSCAHISLAQGPIVAQDILVCLILKSLSASTAYHVHHLDDTATATCTAAPSAARARTKSSRSKPHESNFRARRAVWPLHSKLSAHSCATRDLEAATHSSHARNM